MVDFYVILGMDWFHSCFSSIDCRISVAKLYFPNEPVLEGKGGNLIPCIKSRKMISKGCLYLIVIFKDLVTEIPPIK